MRYRDQPPPQGYQLVPRSPPRRRSSRAAAEPGRSGCAPASVSATGAPCAPTPSPRRSTARWPRASTLLDTSTHGRSSAPRMFTPAARPRDRRRRAREDAGHQLHRPGGVRRLDDDAVLLRCSADPAAERGRRPPSPGPALRRRGVPPDDRITIRRNRYYGGDRVHHVDGFDVDLHANSPRSAGRIGGPGRLGYRCRSLPSSRAGG